MQNLNKNSQICGAASRRTVISSREKARHDDNSSAKKWFGTEA